MFRIPSFSQQKLGFNPKPVHMGLKVENAALRHILRALGSVC